MICSLVYSVGQKSHEANTTQSELVRMEAGSAGREPVDRKGSSKDTPLDTDTRCPVGRQMIAITYP